MRVVSLHNNIFEAYDEVDIRGLLVGACVIATPLCGLQYVAYTVPSSPSINPHHSLTYL